MPVTPNDAATVIIVRPATGRPGGGFEVLMALRNRNSSFVPGSFVFPGGRVERGDRCARMKRLVDDAGRAALGEGKEGGGDAELDAAIRIAAIRETFEEVGLLYAFRRGESSLVSFEAPGLLERFRRYGEMLRSKGMTLADMLEREDLVLDLGKLYFFSHWITPELLPRRFDTRFFVALAPPGQEALHDGDEMTTHRWVTPREALDEYHRNIIHMVVPTVVTLEELGRFDTIEEVIASVEGKRVTGILTRIVITEGVVEEYAPDGRIFRHTLPPQ